MLVLLLCDRLHRADLRADAAAVAQGGVDTALLLMRLGVLLIGHHDGGAAALEASLAGNALIAVHLIGGAAELVELDALALGDQDGDAVKCHALLQAVLNLLHIEGVDGLDQLDAHSAAHAGNVNMDSRIIALDLYEMGEQLRPTALVVTLEAIQNRVAANRKRGKFTWVFIDECYLYFKYKYSADVLYRAWKRWRKYGAPLTAATQNVEECLKSETARLMLANSEFLLLFNQAATDRAELGKLLRLSDTQMGYVTNVEAGHGLLRMGGALVPFVNTIPKDTELYRLMTTTPNEKFL